MTDSGISSIFNKLEVNFLENGANLDCLETGSGIESMLIVLDFGLTNLVSKSIGLKSERKFAKLDFKSTSAIYTNNYLIIN